MAQGAGLGETMATLGAVDSVVTIVMLLEVVVRGRMGQRLAISRRGGMSLNSAFQRRAIEGRIRGFPACAAASRPFIEAAMFEYRLP